MSEIHTDEISFRELVESIRSYIIEIFKYWYVILILAIPLSAYFFYQHKNFKINYNAETKFIVEGGNSLSSGIGGLLGQIGLRGAGGGKFNNFKIVEVARSKKILSKILFEKYEGELIANILFKKYEYDQRWGKDNPEFLNFKFINTGIENFSNLEAIAFNGLIGLIIGDKNGKNALLSISYNEDEGIYSIYSNVRNEGLTLKMAELNYSFLKDFFENELVESQIKTTKIIKSKADSIDALIRFKTRQIANIQDRSYGLVLNSPAIQKNALEKEIAALVSAQSEFLKSYEMADIGLRDIRASFIKLDETIGPLKPNESSLTMNMIKAIGLSFFIGSVFISLRKLYRDAL
jgi:hypothetical protein